MVSRLAVAMYAGLDMTLLLIGQDAAAQINPAPDVTSGNVEPRQKPDVGAQAPESYEKEKDGANAIAMYNSGVIFANGEGVRQDYGQARLWFQQSANAATRPRCIVSDCYTPTAWVSPRTISRRGSGTRLRRIVAM